MRAFNVFLSLLVSVVMALVVLEFGLRAIGKGPPDPVLEFDAATGWRKRAGVVAHRKGPEHDVTLRTNERGLADDPMPSTAKPDGAYRVLVLGDSFTQGFTVGRDDLYVDLLERRWKAEGRSIDIVNAGTEGWSTDQEVVWLAANGERYQPDLVILQAYENDLYWNGQSRYIDRGTHKPLFRADGQLEVARCEDLGPRPWTERFATTRLLTALVPPESARRAAAEHLFTPPGATRPVLREFGVLLNQPPEFVQRGIEGTTGALLAFRRECERLGARPLLLAIPSHSSVDPAHAPRFAEAALGGLPVSAWSPDSPVELVTRLAGVVGIPSLDPRPALRAAQQARPQYFEIDWHLNPDGNRSLAAFLHDELDARGFVPPAFAASVAVPPDAPAAARGRDWTFIGALFAALWLALSLVFVGTYPDESRALAPLKVGSMLAVVFGLVLGLQALLALVPPALSGWLAGGFVCAVLAFVAWKLGRRLATIVELLRAFALRGHWYLMPLLVVLLTIGSLLVVAASSPLIAPFIYTLF